MPRGAGERAASGGRARGPLGASTDGTSGTLLRCTRPLRGRVKLGNVRRGLGSKVTSARHGSASPKRSSNVPFAIAFARWWPLLLALSFGIFAGMAAYTFLYARGLSYFSTEPEACVNCHIMQPQYDGWQKASHHAVAVCVDCHLPESFVPKYLAKAENGWRHGKMFTTQDFEEPIVVHAPGRRILQDNCVRCHGAFTASMLHAQPSAVGEQRVASPHWGPTHGLECMHCHAAVGHGERAAMGGPLRPHELQLGVAPRPMEEP